MLGCCLLTGQAARQARHLRSIQTRRPPGACRLSRPTPHPPPCLTTTGTDIAPIVPALEKIWRDSKGQQLSDFNFRTVTSKFNELVYQYPIRIPERYSLVIRSLLTQVGGWEGGFRWLTGATIAGSVAQVWHAIQSTALTARL